MPTTLRSVLELSDGQKAVIGLETLLADVDGPLELTATEAQDVAAYLEFPNREGFWRMSGAWIRANPFSEYLWNIAKTSFHTQGASKKQKAATEELEFLNKVQSDQLAQMAERASTVFRLFYLAVLHEKGVELPGFGKDSNSFLEAYGPSIDLADFRKTFAAAYSVFRDRVWHFALPVNLLLDQLIRTGAGYIFVLRGPSEGGNVEMCSNKAAAMEAIADFLSKAGVITSHRIVRVFSPEEEVFQPYFAFLAAAFPRLIDDKRNRPNFNKAFQHYKEGDFRHCIGVLGLIGEDYLIQVFESYLREPCKKGLTLGQVFDLIHERIRKMLQPAKPEQVNLDLLYEGVRKLPIAKSGDTSHGGDALAGVLREIIGALKQERKTLDYKFRELHHRDIRNSVFPMRIRDNLEELIYYRNAASHKSRIPIGSYEALRTLYCVTSFVLWWKNEVYSLDWNKESEPLIRSSVGKYST